jgi:glycosyltransferase involved in cell wall biosynthesis
MAPLNILHVLRAPVGGLFRHVVDLSREQVARGHRVGVIADLNTGGERAEGALRKLEPALSLGLTRLPMDRHIGWSDHSVVADIKRRIAETQPDVVHGHGAKGGAYARLACNDPRAVRAYTPHGGSLLFSYASLAGMFYLNAERYLMRRGDLFLFESAYSANMFRRKIGRPRGLVRVVHNGVSRAEFETILARADATDLVFLGELRRLKGIDVLIDAIGRLRRGGRTVTATLVGDGPDRDAFRAQVARLNLTDAIQFKSAMPAYEALTLGRIMVVASRQESLPYVVLEGAAGGKTLIATRVGGIPEIYGPLADALVPPGNAAALARAIADTLDNPAAATERTQALRDRVAAEFSVQNMVDGILAAYRAALEKAQQMGRR